MLKEKLQEFGFSDKEAKVYLALVEIGSAVASDIARKAGINRSTTYVILDSLAERGLIKTTDRRGVKIYNAAPPEQLIQYLKGMAKRYTTLADTAKELIPELKSSQSQRENAAPAPKVQVFQGSEGIKTVYEETLASLEEIRAHANFEHEARKKAARGKAESGMKIDTIYLNTPSDRKRVAPDTKDLRKVLVTSREKSEVTSEINIYDDRVVFISPNENFALVAESKELANALKKMCDAAVQGVEAEMPRDKAALIKLSPAFG